MSQSRSPRWSITLLLLAAAVGLVLALYAYLTPLTGVTGTLGALVVIVANIIIALLAFLLRRCTGRGARLFWGIVTLVGLVGTGFAALLLHQPGITAAMAVGLIGLVASIGCPASHNKSRSA